ncbi:hypothetical protein JW921_09915 [Candidatus Fermentibacterales bacterium]|nr:hypothetical protein [Candidatus Fermentibacterales bacterium]
MKSGVLRFLLVRLLMASPFLFLAFSWIIGPLGLVFLALAGWVLAAPVAEGISEWCGLFHPGGSRRSYRPAYSVPEARLQEGRIEDAFALYQEIALSNPEDALPAFVGMIGIAAGRLRDAPRAARVFRWGLASLRRPGDRRALSREYRWAVRAMSEADRLMQDGERPRVLEGWEPHDIGDGSPGEAGPDAAGREWRHDGCREEADGTGGKQG